MVFIIMKIKRKGDFDMKSKVFLAAGLTAMTLLSTFPPTTAWAQNSSVSTFALFMHEGNVTPRYSYIQRATIAVYPSEAGAEYILDIRGIASVTSISGTATLYKENSSGNYVEIDSEKLSFQGNSVDYTGYLKSSGSGNYKIVFNGTVYTDSGKESVSFRNLNSY